ncbi:hypothetical protein B0H63DRAFT_483437 [Podospora didyma]|uniref:Leucine-rich repeat-containing protein n=1 Tax=Podospora didyma TaxID=330526 RepID=A0AAE0N5Z8_9PEZI|nr:hypothetical protein B0H63DRAFT_483437 [Podospora didyma]
MADNEPSLPVLPGHPLKRARGTATNAPLAALTSSDPAVFSSDDDPALDNYVHGRRKKRYVGSWFDQHPASSDSALGDEEMGPPPVPLPKREFRRQLDSGVWMPAQDAQDGSIESSDSSAEPIESSGEANDEWDLSVCQSDDDVFVRTRTSRSSMVPMPRTILSDEELLAQSIVDACNREGRQVVDLSSLGLSSLSADVLGTITQIAPIPVITKDVHEEYKAPRIQLFLNGNLLRLIPVAIVNVEHLTHLSLRMNNLVELPPSFAALKNLESLNVGQNSLRFLPSELLPLLKKGSKLRELLIHPNPFYQPQDARYCAWGVEEYQLETFGPVDEAEVEIGNEWTGMTTILRARTPVQFSRGSRGVCSGFRFPQDTEKLDQEDFWELAVPSEHLKWSRRNQLDALRGGPKGPRSLVEMCLRLAARAEVTDQEYLALRLDHLVAAARRAGELHKMGGQICCICKRETLIPATEWVEFHEVQQTTIKMNEDGTEIEQIRRVSSNNGIEPWVPFMRRGCSWACLPHKAEPPTTSEQRSRLLALP